MNIAATVSQLAARDPSVGVAVAATSVKSSILAGMVSGDTNTASLIANLVDQQLEEAHLLQTVTATEPGQKLDLRA
ncbi:MAG TPA: hypothetical protein VGK19_07870 [Capsulimonadaceae bacterium]|jgi:hypothetical protein